MIKIAVVNYSSQVSDAQVAVIIPALQGQVDSDFGPIWGVEAAVSAAGPDQVTPEQWVMGIFDNADQADALGYHSLTPAGQPLMKIFVTPALQNGDQVSMVMSHELLETLADPWIESLALRDNGDGTGRLYALEVCDAVEGDSYTGAGGVSLSNFITPWWFSGQPPAGAKFDFLGNLSAAFTLSPGGYFNYMDVSLGAGWQQTFGEKANRNRATERG
ncbi:MAG TPA: hypothetical protein VEU62_19085 [Bryobacterales bacterium]|nr:hypothetical protein [Bryobacterales bacterium]